MNWTALAYVLVILIAILSLLFLWVWPRNPDGTFMDLDEVAEFMDKFPRAPTGVGQYYLIMFFATLGMIGIALTHHDHDDHDHH